MNRLVIGLTVLTILAAFAHEAALAAEPDESVVTDLDAVRIGTQVSGATRLLRQDLEGRVVLAFHWCVSCPMSTGAFPYVNQLVRNYRDRGLLVVGLQVRRQPEVAENDVVWYLEHLRPEFPVFRLGWNREWPSRYLPWAVLFDHEGNEVFANNLPGIEAAIERALERAPSPLMGASRDQTSARLAELRRVAAGESENRDEARTMLAAVERDFERQIARAKEAIESVVEREQIYARLALTYEGDSLGERAEALADALRSSATFAGEAAAEDALRQARRTFRRLPPPGGYIYHFTDMNYAVSDDPALIATRTRMIAQFRIVLDRIVAAHPDTHAASVAADLLFEHDVPEMTADAARERVERAERLLAEGESPGELHEAHLLLFEVQEGYLSSDETANRADQLLSSLRKKRAGELAPAEGWVRGMEDDVSLIQKEIQSAGSLLPRKRADELAKKLAALAREVGPDTLYARHIATYVDRLLKSYDGPAHVGVSLDGRYPGPGARLAAVHPGTGAQKAGLVPGDVVLELAGETLENASGFAAALADRKPEQTVKAEVRRASGKVEVVEILLGRKP